MGDGVRRVELEPEDRAGRVEIFIADAFEHVADRQEQRLNREAARFIQRDQCSAVRDELPELVGAVAAHAARVRRGVARRQSVKDLSGTLIGKNDDVELITQFACAHHGVYE